MSKISFAERVANAKHQAEINKARLDKTARLNRLFHADQEEQEDMEQEAIDTSSEEDLPAYAPHLESIQELLDKFTLKGKMDEVPRLTYDLIQRVENKKYLNQAYISSAKDKEVPREFGQLHTIQEEESVSSMYNELPEFLEFLTALDDTPEGSSSHSIKK